jgi:multicomponent Na+:H+ antiporter subunit B
VIQSNESIIIRTVARMLVPFIQLFGLYVIMHGHSSPGGGFQGGVILGASFILLGIAFGVDKAKARFNVRRLTIFTSLGVIIYAGIGLVCLLLDKNFLNYGALPIHEPRGMGMFGIELGVGFTVMSVMVSLYYDLIEFK